MTIVFNDHYRYADRHSFLSPSKYHWINYDPDKMRSVYETQIMAAKGSALHELAKRLITHRVKLPRNRKTINAYVNDAIGYMMTPELILYYSDNCFGTADALSFRMDVESGLMLLRIHDLKTGKTRTSVHQLEVYAAIFCLEYDFNPSEILMEFRIYQNDDVQIYDGDPAVVQDIMNKIVSYDRIIEEMKAEALL